MAFDVSFYAKLALLYYKCVVNPATNKTEWMYTKPGDLKKHHMKSEAVFLFYFSLTLFPASYFCSFEIIKHLEYWK